MKTAIRPALLRFAAAAVLGALASCSATVKVKTDSASVSREALRQTDLLRAIAVPNSPALASLADDAEKSLRNARRSERRDSVDAAGSYLLAAVEAQRLLVSGGPARGSQAEEALLDLHNRSLARFVELWIDDPRPVGADTFRFETEKGPLEFRLAADSAYAPSYFDRAIASLSVTETGVERQDREGYGAAFVGIREQRPERAQEMKFYPRRGLHVPVTLTVDSVSARSSDGVTRVSLALRDPLQEESVRVGGRSFPLTTDFSAPIAVILNHQSQTHLGMAGFFHADREIGAAGIFLTEPYDPDRIPLLLIHGLVSSPIIWRDLIPHLMAEPELARRYQFLVFRYPSGLPVSASAELLRDDLARIRAHYDPNGNDPLSRNLVVAGHSMGGILTHTLAVEMGDHLWRQINPDTPFDRIEIDAVEKEELRRALFFNADPAVGRVVYFSAPHRGATMAEKGIAGLVSQAARLPGAVLASSQVALSPGVLTNPHLQAFAKKNITSAQSLRPGAPVVAALDVAPYRAGVKYHSIIGDRGKGDTPNSSDGVVEYWSSHQEGAESELIVPTGHSSYTSPLAVAELKRILRLHAGIR